MSDILINRNKLRAVLRTGAAGMALVSGAAISQTPAAAPTSASDKANDPVDGSEIVVTGTSIRGAKQPTGSGLVVVDRQSIEKTSASNTADLLAQVPTVNSFNTQPRVSDVGASGSTAPGLRGLPSTATLILLNGHRLVGDTPLGTSPDPSAIPPEAIERIEIVGDGASAVYGSDAVAGVINIITRRRFDGFRINGRYGFADGYQAFDANGIGGFDWAGGSLTVAGSYSGNSHLQNKERGFYYPDGTAFGGQDSRGTNCSPPNVTIGGTTYAPPNFAAGPAARCDLQGDADILSRNRRASVLLTAEHNVSSGIKLFGDIKYTDTKTTTIRPYPATSLTISNTNPFFRLPPGAVGTTENLDYSLNNIFTRNPQYRYRIKAGGVTGGGDFKLGGGFNLNVTGTYGWSKTSALNETFNAGALGAAAAGTTTATALDPFGNGTNSTVANSIQDFGLAFIADQSLFDLTARVDGALFALPGGEVKVAVGGGYRREGYGASNPAGAISTLAGGASVDASRKIKSVFGEILIPVIGQDMNVPAIRALEFSLAGRYDDYNDFGSTTNPKFGVRWEVLSGVSLRASYGKSFHAPSLADTQAVDTRALYFAGFPLSVDFTPRNTIALAGGNPNLRPERAKTYSAGIDIVPPSLSGLRVSATYFDITYRDQVQSLISFFPFPFFTDPNLIALGVINNPTAAQVAAITSTYRLEGFPANLPAIGQIIDFRRVNLSQATVRGIDFSVAYRWTGSLGSWNAGLSGVRQIDNDIKATPFAPADDQFEMGRGAIKWRLRGEAGWSKGPLRADVAVNYTGPYRLSYSTTAGAAAVQKVDSYTTVNFRAQYDLPLGSGTSLTLNVDDLFDKKPPLVLGNLNGFDSGRINPIGRMVWVGVRQTF